MKCLNIWKTHHHTCIVFLNIPRISRLLHCILRGGGCLLGLVGPAEQCFLMALPSCQSSVTTVTCVKRTHVLTPW